MNFYPQGVNTWQLMYTQLLSQYSTLAHNYHAQAETNNALYKELQHAMEEKISLLQGSATNIRTQVSLPLNIAQDESVRLLPREADSGQKLKLIRRSRNYINRKGKVFRCRFSDCKHSFHCLASLRQHVRSKHDGSLNTTKGLHGKKDIL